VESARFPEVEEVPWVMGVDGVGILEVVLRVDVDSVLEKVTSAVEVDDVRVSVWVLPRSVDVDPIRTDNVAIGEGDEDSPVMGAEAVESRVCVLRVDVDSAIGAVEVPFVVGVVVLAWVRWDDVDSTRIGGVLIEEAGIVPLERWCPLLS
jgi:hypothetical protein